MKNKGWIKLHRKLLKWEWIDDNNTRWLFIYCLLSANHKQTVWHGVTIKKGSFITSQPHLAKSTRFTVRQIRVSLDKLQMTGELTVKATNRYSLITINKWEDYQQDDSQSVKKMTGQTPTNDRQMTTNKNDKNDNNINTSDFVLLLSKFNELAQANYQTTKGRENKYATRRKRYSAEDILVATTNMLANSFYLGDNDRGWRASPDFILKSDEQIDRFLNMKPKVTSSQYKRYVPISKRDTTND